MLLAAFTFAQILSYPFPEALVRDKQGTAIAYTLDTQGVRTIWFARAPDFSPRQLFSSVADDGQEITNFVISNDDSHVVYVRGGDHDANWPDAAAAEPRLVYGATGHAGLVGFHGRPFDSAQGKLAEAARRGRRAGDLARRRTRRVYERRQP